MSVTAAIRKLLADGFTMEQALAAAEAFEEAMKPERTARQDRNARYYAKKASEKRLKASETSYSDESVLNKTPSREPARVEDNLQTKILTGQGKKKERSPRDELAAVLDAEHVDAVLDHRQRLRKPLSPHAAKLLAGSLSGCPDPNAAADVMIESGWLKIKPGWLESRQQRSHGPPRNDGVVGAAQEIFREKGWTSEHEPEFVPRHNGNGEQLPAERGSGQAGAVVDLREGTDWHRGSGH